MNFVLTTVFHWIFSLLKHLIKKYISFVFKFNSSLAYTPFNFLQTLPLNYLLSLLLLLLLFFTFSTLLDFSLLDWDLSDRSRDDRSRDFRSSIRSDPPRDPRSSIQLVLILNAKSNGGGAEIVILIKYFLKRKKVRRLIYYKKAAGDAWPVLGLQNT